MEQRTVIEGTQTAVQATVSAAQTENVSLEKIKKVIVAVHGIGDQTSYATVQSALFQFSRVYGIEAAVPLGKFHNVPIKLDDGSEFVPPYESTEPPIAFAEVYWAGIPRRIATEYQLEETKMWGKTIVERMKAQARATMTKANASAEPHSQTAGKATTQKPAKENPIRAGHKRIDEDSINMEQVLGEMLSALGVLERVCYLADKANLFRFDLNRVLNNYLIDVQILAEFDSYRKEILGIFSKLMRGVHAKYKSADIYIIAHSEGTVISLFGLLEAICSKSGVATQAAGPEWIRRVRGFMTIGSPIDTHLLLWPALFEKYRTPDTDLVAHSPKIKWRNYYDKGDPIGDKVDTTREWLRNNWGEYEYEKIFDFKGEERYQKAKSKATGVPRVSDDPQGGDYGFVRYPLPGKAHTGYWTDDEVFGHFIETVVRDPQTDRGGDQQDKARSRYVNPPGDKFWWKYTSWWLPYLVGFVVLFVGVFLLQKAILAVSPNFSKGVSTPDFLFPTIFWEVLSLTLLLSGLTAMTRIFRLTKQMRYRIIGVLLFLVSSVAYYAIRYWGEYITDVDPTRHWRVVAGAGAISLLYFLWFGLKNHISRLQGGQTTMGVKALLFIGSLAIASIMWVRHSNIKLEQQTASASIWPLFLAGALFLYLWWLAIHIFDLTFVWHRYIRTSEGKECIKNQCGYAAKPQPRSWRSWIMRWRSRVMRSSRIGVETI